MPAADPIRTLLLCLCLCARTLAAGTGAGPAEAPALGDGACGGATGSLPGQPADADACYGRALCLQGLGRLREALASVDQALSLKPGLEPAQRLRRTLLAALQAQACRALCASADQDRALGRRAEAERGYRLALSLDPGCAEALGGLAALGWPKGQLADILEDADRANPGSAQAQGLRSLLVAARGVDARASASPEAPAAWTGFLRSGLQQSVRTAPAGDQDGADALLFGRLERRAQAWDAAYSYFLDFNRSSTGTARVDYHSLNLQWAPGASAWSLQVDEAMEWSQGQPAYWHQLAELRRTWAAAGPWRAWTGLQALWENFPSSAELDAFGPSLAVGLGGPVPWGGHLGLELRLRGDDTQSWDDRDGSLGCHASLVWRSGEDFSPRLDLDAKSQEFPDWPGGPGRWDRSLDARLELTLWQDRLCQFSAGDEAWNHLSTVAAYSELGNSVFVAGTFFW